MHRDVTFAAGFAAGLVKAAAGDNQPGPATPKPAPPDSRLKRGVAVGAGLLVGGILAAKPALNFAKSQHGLATTLAKNTITGQRASQGRQILSGLKSSNPALREQAQRIAPKWQQLAKQPVTPSAGQKVKALAGHYADKVKGLPAELGRRQAAKEVVRQDIGGQASRDAQHAAFKKQFGIRAPYNEERKQQLIKAFAQAKRKRIGGKLMGAAGTAAVLGGAAVAGSSAASRAAEPQSSDQPGLG